MRAAAGCAGVLAIAAMALTGCRIDSQKDGDHENVKIATPFGGMSVKTNDAVVQEGVGLSVYPGSTLNKKAHVAHDGKEHDEGAADVNMSFGNFHLRVKALSYTSPDPPEKVIEYYRHDMARYGVVILCRGQHPVGTPIETKEGLTCNDDKHTHVQNVDEDSDQQLKAGSKLHQHIVGIDPQGTGTRIGLVALDLPGHLGIEDDDTRQ